MSYKRRDEVSILPSWGTVMMRETDRVNFIYRAGWHFGNGEVPWYWV